MDQLLAWDAAGMVRRSVASWLDLKLLFVLGKGGVGKSTVAAAVALSALRRGKRVLVAMCNAKERLSHLLETDEIGHTNQEVLPNLDAVNMTPQEALKEYGRMILKVPALYSAVFENQYVIPFLRGVPGLEAWSMLGKAYYHAMEEQSGQRRYDLVIVDAPATGHALDMLRVPQVLTDVAPPGLLRSEADAAMKLFRDPNQSAALIVSIPEEMPTTESIELYRALDQELRIPVATVVANGVLPSLFGPDDELLVQAFDRPAPSNLRALLEAGRRRSIREGLQKEHLGRLRTEIPRPQIELPYLFVPTFQRSAIESLSQAFR